MVDEEPWELDEEAFLAEWEAADRQAAELLESMLAEELAATAPGPEVEEAADRLRAGVETGDWPFDYFVSSLGWRTPPALPADEVVLDAVAATISPLADPGTSPEQQAAVAALAHAEWLAIVVGLVRDGVGAELSPEGIAVAFGSLDEIGDEEPVEPGEFAHAVEVLAPLWRATGVLDEDDRLTEVGRWALPQALSLVWTHQDGGAPFGSRLPEEHAVRAMALLAERPRTFEELADVLVAEGVDTDADEVYRSLIWRPEVYGFDDGVYAHLPTLAEGIVLSHRLTAQERELGLLPTGLDLELFGLLCLEGHLFSGGGALEVVEARPGVAVPDGALGAVRGPEGWLDGYAAGDLLGLRYDGQAIALVPVQLPAPAEQAGDVETVAEVARAVAGRHAEIGDPMLPGVPSYHVVLEARRTHPGLFRSPLPPLSELLAGVSGIELEHESIGVPGTDWQDTPDWLTGDEREAYVEWKHVLREHRVAGTLPSREDAAALARSLTGRMLGLAAFDLTLEPHREPVAESMAAAVEGPAAAVPLYLRARAAEGRGDGPAWAALLEEAVAADPTMEDPTAELADLRALAGDAKAAHRLYGMAGFDTGADEMRDLRRFLEPATGEVGRNHPCPCGSGKKYKLCHGREARHPLPERAVWLWSKATLFARRDLNRQVLLDWAELLAGSEPDLAPQLVEAPVTAWFALFDGGVLQRLLDLHGGILPEDERGLVEHWLAAGPRLLEVTEVAATKPVAARDLVTDEVVSFRNRSGVPCAPGDVLLCRLLEDGSGQPALLHPPIPVPPVIRHATVQAFRDGASPRQLAVLVSVGMVGVDGEHA